MSIDTGTMTYWFVRHCPFFALNIKKKQTDI